MRNAALILLTITVGSLLVCGRPALTGSGGFSFALDAASTSIVVEAAFSAEATWDAFTTRLSLLADEGGLTTLDLECAFDLDTISMTCGTAFDIQSASFTCAEASLAMPGERHDLTLTAVLENGLGFNASMASEGVVHTIDIGLNLDSFHRVQTDSCALPFTYAEVEAAIPVADCITVNAQMLVEDAGFAELVLSCGGIAGLPIGVQFAATLVFEPEAKSLDLSPSFSLEGTECIDLYAGLSWDATTHTISGIEIYGLGAHCEFGDVRFRGLWPLDPTTIALVKAPYWALLGLVWDLPGCCGDLGEGSVALFFGEENLFGLGAIEAEFVVPISPASTVTLDAVVTIDGGFTLTFGWSVGTQPPSE